MCVLLDRKQRLAQSFSGGQAGWPSPSYVDPLFKGPFHLSNCPVRRPRCLIWKKFTALKPPECFAVRASRERASLSFSHFGTLEALPSSSPQLNATSCKQARPSQHISILFLLSLDRILRSSVSGAVLSIVGIFPLVRQQPATSSRFSQPSVRFAPYAVRSRSAPLPSPPWMPAVLGVISLPCRCVASRA